MRIVCELTVNLLTAILSRVTKAHDTKNVSWLPLPAVDYTPRIHADKSRFPVWDILAKTLPSSGEKWGNPFGPKPDILAQPRRACDVDLLSVLGRHPPCAATLDGLLDT
jgi:hypothetical protein